MYTTNLRRVGGSVMLAVPPAVLNLLDLDAGAKVTLSVRGGQLVIERRRRPHYRLSELLAQCNRKGRVSRQERQWLDAPPAGRELL
jgi:antitoxin ChpS